MKNVENYRTRKCIVMDFDEYNELIKKVTDNKISVSYDCYDNELTYKTVEGTDNVDFVIAVALSKYFDVTVTSVHADGYDTPYMWIVYKED